MRNRFVSDEAWTGEGFLSVRACWRRRTALALVLLMAPPSLARNETDFKAALESVSRLYEELEYEGALVQVQLARDLIQTPEDEVTLSLYKGLLLAELRRWEEATVAFREALTLHSEAKLPVQVAPKVTQHFERVRKEVQQELAAKPQKPEPSSALSEAPKLEPELPEPPPEWTPEGVTGPSLATEANPQAASSGGERSFLRPRHLVPAIGGGVLLVAGGTSWAFSRRELSRIRGDDPNLATQEELRRTASSGSTYQTLGVGMVGAGLVGLGVAVGLYLLEAPPGGG